jgi:hypothetical protein
MSLQFRIDAVHFDQEIHPEVDKHLEWLKSKKLREHYSNLKATPISDGKVIYKQKSKSNKVDTNQQAFVTVEPGIILVGSFKTVKYRTERQKREQKPTTPEPTASTHALQPQD